MGGPNFGETIYELDLLKGATNHYWLVLMAGIWTRISCIRVLFAMIPLLLPRVVIFVGSASTYYEGCDKPKLDLARSMEDLVGLRWLLLGRCLLAVSVPKLAEPEPS